MWELFHVLPLLIGRSVAPVDMRHYQCFLQLQQIAAIVCSPVIAVPQIAFLRVIIRDYLRELKSLYPHQNLVPKFHYLIHIPTIIERYYSKDIYTCVLITI